MTSLRESGDVYMLTDFLFRLGYGKRKKRNNAIGKEPPLNQPFP